MSDDGSVLVVGEMGQEYKPAAPLEPGAISLNVHACEVMRFEANGDILVKGRLVENDREVVDAFREWLAGVRL